MRTFETIIIALVIALMLFCAGQDFAKEPDALLVITHYDDGTMQGKDYIAFDNMDLCEAYLEAEGERDDYCLDASKK